MPAKSFRGLVAVLARYRPVNSRTRPDDRVHFYFLIAHNDLQNFGLFLRPRQEACALLGTFFLETVTRWQRLRRFLIAAHLKCKKVW
jgi:hypothetical protein